MVRKSIESSYIGKCDIVEYANIITEDKSTNFEEVTVYLEQPCKLSFTSGATSSSNGVANSISQTVKLFIAPEIDIKPGSKIIITQNETISIYKNSGEPLRFNTHQEIMLDLFEGWA